MTSSLRRKRQITRPTALSETAPRRWPATPGGWLAGLAVAALIASAAAAAEPAPAKLPMGVDATIGSGAAQSAQQLKPLTDWSTVQDTSGDVQNNHALRWRSRRVNSLRLAGGRRAGPSDDKAARPLPLDQSATQKATQLQPVEPDDNAFQNPFGDPQGGQPTPAPSDDVPPPPPGSLDDDPGVVPSPITPPMDDDGFPEAPAQPEIDPAPPVEQPEEQPRRADPLPAPPTSINGRQASADLCPCDGADGDRCACAACFRKMQTIDKISLDITPPLRPLVHELRGGGIGRQFNRNCDAGAASRSWKTEQGRVIGEGPLEIADERGAVRVADGSYVPYYALSREDRAAFDCALYLPEECFLAARADRHWVDEGRLWTPLTYTWKASGLCHKPLYFQDIALERYGHTAGPIRQPILSGAHFFANIAILPYNMGVYPMNECRYALGYYRPGSCAPWLVPPFPLSLRGAVMQAGAATGVSAIIP